MGILANLGYGAILGPELQGKVLKPFEKAVTVMQLDEPNKAMMEAAGYKKGGSVKSSASRRADGAAKRGKTKGRTL
jgi:hypothetical protein